MVIAVLLVEFFWPSCLNENDPSDPMPDAILGLLFGGLVFVIPALRARLVGLSIRASYMGFPHRDELVPLTLLAIPMLGVAFAGIYFVYAPLSLVFPAATQAWLFEDQPVLYSAVPPYPLLGNSISLVSIAVVTPIAEEWFFRGLLFRRWLHKWGTLPAVIASSLAFAIAHADILGAFVFGVVMCALFARSGSLWAPTIVHATNNAIVWCLAAIDSHGLLPIELETVAQLRSAWWLPVLGLIMALPWAVRARHDYRLSSWEFAM